MNTTEVENNKTERRSSFKQKISNLTDCNLRLKINEAEGILAQLESKQEKTKEEFKQLDSVKEKLKLLLQQSKVPFRLTNTIWFNRPNSIFFSIKNNFQNTFQL